jgi:peroxiredoxin Q/BCP
MVELRKRPAPPPAPPPAKKRGGPKAKAKKENGVAAEPSKPAAASGGAPKVGDTITLDGFGGEIETQDEKKVTLAQLVADSKAGVVLFTYPKASTPGCEFTRHISRPTTLAKRA